MMVRAGVVADNVERTLASIDREITAVLTDGLSEKEIEESKRYLVGSIPRQLETNAAIAGFLLSSEFYGLGVDYDVHLPSLLGDVTRAHANQVARRLLDPARAQVVVAGPWAGPHSADTVILTASGDAAALSTSDADPVAALSRAKDQS
jgi:zinc protease